MSGLFEIVRLLLGMMLGALCQWTELDLSMYFVFLLFSDKSIFMFLPFPLILACIVCFLLDAAIGAAVAGNGARLFHKVSSYACSFVSSFDCTETLLTRAEESRSPCNGLLL